MDQAIDLRSKCPHFRILVVGRANAGKTTLLKKVCNSVEDPDIFTPGGDRLDLAVVEGSAERGEHDIENQLIFKSNRQFIFHDSRGFESGSANEIQKVKDFITARSGSSTLSDQLHAIWYCMPTDTNRPLLAADEQFFNVSGTGKVPVIAIFTKFDGLIKAAFNELRGRGKSIPDARDGAPERAQAILTSNFIGPLNTTKFRPSDFVRLDDMRMEQSDCIELINQTAQALSDDTLKLLFVSVQQNNIDLCIGQAMGYLLHITFDDVTRSIENAIAWFPHTWNTQTIYDSEHDVHPAPYYLPDLVNPCTAALTEKFPALVEMIQTPDGHSLLYAALCICLAQTFIDGSAKALGFAPAFAAALDAYVGSRTEEAVVDEIREITDSTHPPQPASPPLPERTNTSTSRWFPQPAWLKKRKDQKRKEREEREERDEREAREREQRETWEQRKARKQRQAQPVIDIIRTHRLRFHEERKAQMERANSV